MSVYFNLSFWYKLSGETWWGAIFSAVGCAVLLAVNIIGVPRWGYMACAWGGVAGYGVCVVLSYLVGQRRNPVPYGMWTLGGYFALALLLYGLTVWVKPEALGWRIAWNSLLVVVYVAVVAWNERVLHPELWWLHLSGVFLFQLWIRRRIWGGLPLFLRSLVFGQEYFSSFFLIRSYHIFI
jgi:O-antigen/teichoic acid export membrane protein